MKGVVLAAGKGTRLYPVTKVVPKPLLPIANRMTLEYAFDQFQECGIGEVCIVVGENEGDLRDALGDGRAFGLDLSYVRQPEPKGLAHAVSFTKGFVAGDDFVLYLGDAIYDRPLRPFVEEFVETACANLNLVKEVDDPRRFGVATVEDGRIVRLVEKPKDPESNLAMAGMYVFGPAIWDVLPDLQPSARGEFEITDAIQMLIDRGHEVRAGLYKGEWFDTGTLPSFLQTSSFLTNGLPLLAADAEVTGDVLGHVVIGAGAQVRCASITDSVVFPGARVDVQGDIVGCLLGGDVSSLDGLSSVIQYGDVV